MTFGVPSGRTEGVNIPDKGSASPEYAHIGSSSLLVVIPHQESTTFFLGNSKLALPLPVTCKVAIKGVI